MLALEIPFLLITTAIVIASFIVDFGKPFKLKNIHESRFYMYILYIVAILLTIVRMLSLNLLPSIPKIYFTIIYNWAASLIVVIGSISPGRIGYAVVFEKYEMLTRKGNKTLRYVTCTVLFYLVLLVATIAAFAFGSNFTVSGMNTMAPTVVFAWRIIFMTSVIFEIVWFTLCQFAIHQQNRRMGEENKLKLSPNLLLYLKITPVIHSLIAISILLKYVDQVSSQFLYIAHMLFMIAGMAVFAIKLQRTGGHAPTTSKTESSTKGEEHISRKSMHFKTRLKLAMLLKSQHRNTEASRSGSSSSGSSNSSSGSGSSGSSNSSSSPNPCVGEPNLDSSTGTSCTSSPSLSPTLAPMPDTTAIDIESI